MILCTGKNAGLPGAFGTGGQLGAFLEELYSGVECEVRVGEVLAIPLK